MSYQETDTCLEVSEWESIIGIRPREGLPVDQTGNFQLQETRCDDGSDSEALRIAYVEGSRKLLSSYLSRSVMTFSPSGIKSVGRR